MIITVDCGTTNMRSRLYKGEALVDEVRRKAGVRNTAFSGSTEFLVTSLKESIAELLERNGLNESALGRGVFKNKYFRIRCFGGQSRFDS